ncbi:hypothetical protein [Nocardioides ungokensis]|nr:hypothetical protein [Nocardioides ungokensis]
MEVVGVPPIEAGEQQLAVELAGVSRERAPGELPRQLVIWVSG